MLSYLSVKKVLRPTINQIRNYLVLNCVKMSNDRRLLEKVISPIFSVPTSADLFLAYSAIIILMVLFGSQGGMAHGLSGE